MITLLVMTDGRDDLLLQTIQSANNMLNGPISKIVIHDDTGDSNHLRDLARFYHAFKGRTEIISGHKRLGFGGAIRNAWYYLKEADSNPYIFHLEDDFEFTKHINLWDMMEILSTHPYLAQLALLRQPWNQKEIEAGGLVEARPGAFTFRVSNPAGLNWMEHRDFFTTNPCMYPRRILDVGWPEGLESEGHFGIKLKQQGFNGVSGDQVQFGYFGHREIMVTHIGKERNGLGY